MPRTRPSWARGAVAPGSGFKITDASFNRIIKMIEDNEASIEKAAAGIDLIVHGMVTIVRSEAMKRSFGPAAPRQRSNPAFAYRLPVQRITGRYYSGWYIRRLGRGRWVVGNDSFEALLIETGLFQRNRRPVLKMSTLAMLTFIQQTRVMERYGESILSTRSRVLRMGVPALAGPTGRLP